MGIRGLGWSIWEVLAKYAGRAYIAGPELEDGLRVCRNLSTLRLGTAICFWNLASDTPRHVADAYSSALDALLNEQLDCYLSVKLPPLNFDASLLSEVLQHARHKNTLVHFDSLEPEVADQTFSAIADAARAYPHLGCTLPGRWLRSCTDSEWAVDLGLHVRVVKGQWPDPACPEIDLCQGYLNVIDRLAGRARFVAVATHDPNLGRESIQRLRKAGTPCALELLYGLPVKPALKVAQELSVPVRVYVPYGYGWLPYSFSQAKKNPRIFWWVLRDFLSGDSPFSLGKRNTLTAGQSPPRGHEGDFS
jgi:proline dehydrogenase